jgi:CubicO group peptidase (beta-lactamase class C family)
MPSSLPRGTPADQQVDPAAILAVLDAMDSRPDIEMHSLMVVRHGHVVAEGWWAPYSAGRPQLLYSLSKSFTSTAAAFAQAEGCSTWTTRSSTTFPSSQQRSLIRAPVR